MTIDDDGCSLKTLLTFVPDERKKEVRDHVLDVCKNGCDIDTSFIGFICDYINYAAVLERKLFSHEIDTSRFTGGPAQKKPPLTVYDVGCASAFQHLVFDPRIHYVGIDVGHEPQFFRDNCRFVQGRFADVADQLNIDSEYAIGIANMSLFYLGQPDDWEAFDRLFRRKFVL